MSHITEYFAEVAAIAHTFKMYFEPQLEKLVSHLCELRDRGGTLYIVGLGGSAANASHMSADFRKLCEIDATSLDSMAEVTARANDEGFETIFDGFLNKLSADDALLILSVGGGTDHVSKPLGRAIQLAQTRGVLIFGVVGPDGGYTAKYGNIVLKIPCEQNITPHTEAFQAVLWHCLVSHPKLQRVKTKW